MEEELPSKFQVFLKKVSRKLKEINTIIFLIGISLSIVFIVLFINSIFDSFFYGTDPVLTFIYGGIALGISQILLFLGTKFIQKRITKNELATSSNLLLALGGIIAVLTIFIFLALLIILAAFFGFCLIIGY